MIVYCRCVHRDECRIYSTVRIASVQTHENICDQIIEITFKWIVVHCIKSAEARNTPWTEYGTTNDEFFVHVNLILQLHSTASRINESEFIT